MKQWPVQDAKARFSEMLKASLADGPQVVTVHGVEKAVLVPVQEWRHLRERAPRKLKELLLSSSPRGRDPAIPARGKLRRRAVTAID